MTNGTKQEMTWLYMCTSPECETHPEHPQPGNASNYYAVPYVFRIGEIGYRLADEEEGICCPICGDVGQRL